VQSFAERREFSDCGVVGDVSVAYENSSKRSSGRKRRKCGKIEIGFGLGGRDLTAIWKQESVELILANRMRHHRSHINGANLPVDLRGMRIRQVAELLDSPRSDSEHAAWTRQRTAPVGVEENRDSSSRM